MIDFETAKRIALDYGRRTKYPDCILCTGAELSDCWIFNFATSDKIYIPKIPVRVFKDNGRCDFVCTIDDPDLAKEFREGNTKDFVVTEGCHW